MIEMGMARAMMKVLRIFRRKEQKDNHGQQPAVKYGARHICDGALDKVALVDDRDHRQLRELPVHLLDLVENQPRNFDRICFCLFTDSHPESTPAVDALDSRSVLVGIDDLRYLTNRHNRSVHRLNHGLADIFNVPELRRCPQRHLVPPRLNRPGWEIEIGIVESAQDRGQRNTERFDPIRVHRDTDLPVKTSEKVDLRHPGQPGKAVADLVLNQRRELNRIEISGNAPK